MKISELVQELRAPGDQSISVGGPTAVAPEPGTVWQLSKLARGFDAGKAGARELALSAAAPGVTGLIGAVKGVDGMLSSPEQAPAAPTDAAPAGAVDLTPDEGASLQAAILGSAPPAGTPAPPNPQYGVANDPSIAVNAGQAAELGAVAEQAGSAANERAALERESAALKHEQIRLGIEQASSESRAQSESNLRAFQQQMASIDPTVNSGRYWANKSTGQQIASVLAAAAFGFTGKGLDYLKTIQAAIDSDIEAQKAEYANRVSKVQSAIDTEKGIYTMAMKQFGDSRLAAAAAKESALGVVEARLDAAKFGIGASDAVRTQRILSAKATIAQARQNAMIDITKAKDQLANSASTRWAREEELRLREFEAGAARVKTAQSAGAAVQKEAAGVRKAAADAEVAADAAASFIRKLKGKGIRTVFKWAAQAADSGTPGSFTGSLAQGVAGAIIPEAMAQRKELEVLIRDVYSKSLAAGVLSQKEFEQAKNMLADPSFGVDARIAAMYALYEKSIAHRNTIVKQGAQLGAPIQGIGFMAVSSLDEILSGGPAKKLDIKKEPSK